ncbi:MAG: GntR family transcriptional regulator [Desulfobacteraceae bacterium]|nr:MAG: GntR family transcriptional regulator [Desulfobacteraceae bacterium]
MNKINVYEDIRRQIVEEKLAPGQWLVERELCENYSMSRTPIREILWKLTADGFLEQEANRGFVVRRLGLEQILEIFQAREAIEGMAARLACRRGGEDFHSRLLEIRKALSKANVDSDPKLGVAIGRELHRAIMDASHNSIMAHLYERLENLTLLTANITKRSPAIERASANAHLKIIDAMIQQDEEKGEQLMREHLRETCLHVVEQFYPGMISNPMPMKKGAPQ